MARLVLDIETNGLIAPDKLWCVVTEDIDTGEVNEYLQGDYSRLATNIRDADTLIGHNIIHYDLPILTRMVSDFIFPWERVIDTLILSRLYHFNIRNGHSLKAWGIRLDEAKIEYDKWDEYSPEMLTYCKQDVHLNVKLFKYLDKKLKGEHWVKSRDLEHEMAYFSLEMQANGFYFNLPEAKKLFAKISREKEQLDGRIQAVFKPVTKLVKEVTPRQTKHGTLHSGDFRWMSEDQPDLSGFTSGASFSRFRWVPFNPQSPSQIIDRVSSFGWAPFERSDGHSKLIREIYQQGKRYRRGPTADQTMKLKRYEKYGWKVNKENFSTISSSAPEETKLLIRRLLLGSRCSVLNTWFEAYNTQTGKIHGNFLSLGCWTHRMAHRNPNMGNIPRSDAEFGAAMRRLWTAGPSDTLVGCDASGIQLRILAHYLDNDEFSDTVCTGNEDDGTDIHTRNGVLLGVERAFAKRWIYAWLLGGGPDKLGYLLEQGRAEAIEAADAFMDRYTGLRELKEGLIVSDAARGYFEGVDGRWVICPSKHHMLSGYLQNGESLVMRYATMHWRQQLTAERIPFWPCNLVHDEWQTRTLKKHAETVGQAQVAALVAVGKELNMNCPLDGNYKIGSTWFETH